MTRPATAPRYARAAAVVRAQVADGTLKPGQAAPSGARLAEVTGFAVVTCRRALRSLVDDGTLVPGSSPGARPRVPAPGRQSGTAGPALARTLAGLRRAAGLTQPELAQVLGFSVTTIGHAETGRLWQSRAFWEKADLALSAGGELLRRHDALRAENASQPRPAVPVPAAPLDHAVPGPAVLASVIVVWSDGTATTVYPSGAPEP